MDVVNNPKRPTNCVVRVTTAYWFDGRGLHTKKTVRCMRRSSDIDTLSEDAEGFEARSMLERIEDLYDLPDGLYRLVRTNVYTDRETGYVEDWDYRLIPYRKEQHENQN